MYSPRALPLAAKEWSAALSAAHRKSMPFSKGGVRTSFWMDYEAAVSSHLIQVGPDRDVLSDDCARMVGDDTCKML